MRITQLPAENAHELWPLLRVVHDLHVLHQPERNIADPDRDGCITWLKEMLSDPAHIALVARDENAHPIGYILCRKRRGEEAPVSSAKNHGMIEHISVLPDYHRQGIGRTLIDALKEHLTDEGYTHMSVTYAVFNDASAALMRSVGLIPKIIYAEGEI